MIWLVWEEGDDTAEVIHSDHHQASEVVAMWREEREWCGGNVYAHPIEAAQFCFTPKILYADVEGFKPEDIDGSHKKPTTITDIDKALKEVMKGQAASVFDSPLAKKLQPEQDTTGLERLEATEKKWT